MITVSLSEIQQNLLLYVRRVQAGESVMISDEDHPIAELKPVAVPLETKRPFGLADGEFEIPDDFDDPLPEDVLHGFGV